jgi:L-asparaginase
MVAIDRIVPAAPALLKFDLADLAAMPRVDICHSHIAADGVAIRSFVANGARGIVSAGFGPGMTTPEETEALVEAVRNGVAVVQATRGLSGRVLDGRDNRARGIISAGALSAEKARILLALCLARGDGHDQIIQAFAAA